MKKIAYLCFLILYILFSPVSHSEPDGEWQVLESAHFLIYYHPRMTAGQEIADLAEDFYPRMERLIDGISMGKIEIWVCETQEQFQSSVHAPIQDWAIGCAFPLSRRIVIQNPRIVTEREFQLSQVIRHEIVHVIFGQRTQNTIGDIPLWFVEGVAVYLSGEWKPHDHDTLLEHIVSKSILPLAELTYRFPRSEKLAQLAYAESLNAVAWIVETAGSEKLWEIIDLLGNGSDLNAATEKTLGWNLITFDAKWRESLSQRYHWVALFSSSYLFWGALTLAFFLGYLLIRLRRRRRLIKLGQEESQVDAFFREDESYK